MAERTGLEPATPCVTGRYSNQLNYRSTDSVLNSEFLNSGISPFTRHGKSHDCNTVLIGCLAVPYSRMGRPHTTIGATAFHF